jgi:hypothetical protein
MDWSTRMYDDTILCVLREGWGLAYNPPVCVLCGVFRLVRVAVGPSRRVAW